MRKIINKISWWLVLPFFSILLIGCNTTKKDVLKTSNESKSTYKVQNNVHIEDKTLEIINNTKVEYFSEKESSTKLEDNKDKELEITIEEGEITTVNECGATTTIKGKGIKFGNKEKSSTKQETNNKETTSNKEEKTSINREVSKVVDSVKSEQKTTSSKEQSKQLKKETKRFPSVIAIAIVIFLLIFGILNSFGLIKLNK